MLDFFKKIFRKRKPTSKSAQAGKSMRVSKSKQVSKSEQVSKSTQAKLSTRPGWRKRITKVKEKPRIPRIEWWDLFSLRRRIIIIAAVAGTVLGVWFGIQSYHSSLPMYSLSIATNPGGSVSASVGGIVSPIHANYRDGSSVTLTAMPSAGYEFGSWSGDASGTSPTVTITMDGDKDITADFQAIRYTLSTSTSPSEGGMISTGSDTYEPGSSVVLIATPSPGYEFTSWAGDISGTSPEVTIMMDSDKRVTANFSIVRYRLEVSVNPPEGGTISTGSDTYEPGSPVALAATPAPGYEFISWTGDISGTSPEVTIMMDSDKRVTANFSIVRYRLEVSVSPPEGGTISTGSGTYEPGSPVALAATPAPGYEFISWTGDTSGTSPEVTIMMDSDKRVTANFETIAQRIEYTMPAGEISGSVISFSNVLERGSVVEGFVELTGEYKTRDRTFRWNFEIINPEGRQVDKYRGHWVNKTHHDFNFNVVYNGLYKIKVDHNSLYDLYLVIEIKPKGWESSKP